MKLSEISTRAPKDWDKEKTKLKTQELISEMDELQNILYAQKKYGLLIVIQGMDASGKDGTVRRVFSGVNPMGCDVTAFKVPNEVEASHDFLWRIHHNAPAKGMIQIFNRSHYEDVLVTRVHKLIDDKTAEKRFQYINHFEKLLQSNDTVILKFYLHISHEEQLKRLDERITDVTKNWKYGPEDKVESKLWDQYMKAYEDAIENCGPDIPWTIVPSDQNWVKEHIVAKTIVKTLKDLKLEFPKGIKK